MSAFKQSAKNGSLSIPINGTMSPRDFHSSQQTTNHSKKGMTSGAGTGGPLGNDFQINNENYRKKYKVYVGGQQKSAAIAKNTANLLTSANNQLGKHNRG